MPFGMDLGAEILRVTTGRHEICRTVGHLEFRVDDDGTPILVLHFVPEDGRAAVLRVPVTQEVYEEYGENSS